MRRTFKAWIIVGAPGVAGGEGVWWSAASGSLAIYERKYQSATLASEGGEDARVLRCTINYDDGRKSVRARGRRK